MNMIGGQVCCVHYPDLLGRHSWDGFQGNRDLWDISRENWPTICLALMQDGQRNPTLSVVSMLCHSIDVMILVLTWGLIGLPASALEQPDQRCRQYWSHCTPADTSPGVGEAPCPYGPRIGRCLQWPKCTLLLLQKNFAEGSWIAEKLLPQKANYPLHD